MEGRLDVVEKGLEELDGKLDNTLNKLGETQVKIVKLEADMTAQHQQMMKRYELQMSISLGHSIKLDVIEKKIDDLPGQIWQAKFEETMGKVRVFLQEVFSQVQHYRQVSSEWMDLVNMVSSLEKGFQKCSNTKDEVLEHIKKIDGMKAKVQDAFEAATTLLVDGKAASDHFRTVELLITGDQVRAAAVAAAAAVPSEDWKSLCKYAFTTTAMQAIRSVAQAFNATTETLFSLHRSILFLEDKHESWGLHLPKDVGHRFDEAWKVLVRG